MRRGYKIGPNTRRARIMPENFRLIRLAMERPKLLLGPGSIEARLSKVTGLGTGAVDKTLRRNPQLRLRIREQIDALLKYRINKAIGKGHNTIREISRETGFGRKRVERILTRQKQVNLLPKKMIAASARHLAGQRRGAQTRTSRTLEKIVVASIKKHESLNALVKEAGISFDWLRKLRRTQPVVDTIALDILSRRRALSPEEKARCRKGRIELMKWLIRLRQKKKLGNTARDKRRTSG